MTNSNGTPIANERTNGGTKKKLIINAFVEMCSGHQTPGLWAHPDDHSSEFTDINHWVELAQLLEKAKFHGMFIADVLGGYDVYNGNLEAAARSGAQWPVHEPFSVVAAMAAATESLGFGVTACTTYEQPYHLARRLSTADHHTKGRIGWNIVTSYLDSAAKNLGLKELPQHDDRYDMCEEYIQVVYKLVESSWRDDAVVLDRQKGIFTDPDRIREINHKGKFFEVPGPHICQPSPQRTPLILQAGTSSKGRAFAAKHAEAVFISIHSPEGVKKPIQNIRELAAGFGRDPKSIKVLALFTPIIGDTEEEANRKFEEYQEYISLEGAMALFSGWSGINLGEYSDDEDFKKVETNAVRSMVQSWSTTSPAVPRWTKSVVAKFVAIGGIGPAVVGTPAQIVDEMERWVAEADVDGFNLAYVIKPGSFVDIAEKLLPELRRRDLFWDDYAVPGGTYRENLYGIPGQSGPPDHHPASKYRWKAGVPMEEHNIPG